VLDPAVEDVLHPVAARIAHDAAVSEGTRPPLEAALVPANDVALGYEVGRRGGQRFIVELPVFETVSIERGAA